MNANNNEAILKQLSEALSALESSENIDFTKLESFVGAISEYPSAKVPGESIATILSSFNKELQQFLSEKKGEAFLLKIVGLNTSLPAGISEEQRISLLIEKAKDFLEAEEKAEAKKQHKQRVKRINAAVKSSISDALKNAGFVNPAYK